MRDGEWGMGDRIEGGVSLEPNMKRQLDYPGTVVNTVRGRIDAGTTPSNNDDEEEEEEGRRIRKKIPFLGIFELSPARSRAACAS